MKCIRHANREHQPQRYEFMDEMREAISRYEAWLSHILETALMSPSDTGATNVDRSPMAPALNHSSLRSFRRISTPPKEVKRICGPFVLNDGYIPASRSAQKRERPRC